MQSKEYKLPNGKIAAFQYDSDGVGKVTLECMDELMSMIADRPRVDKEYLTKLIQEAVYDGEACAKLLDLVDRPQGEWLDYEIPNEDGGAMPIQVCSLCKTFYPVVYTGGGHRFCPNCGARMKGADDERG